MYDGCRLKEGLRAGDKPPAPVDVPPPACPHYRGIKKDPFGRRWQIECAVSLYPHVYGYEQKASAQYNAAILTQPKKRAPPGRLSRKRTGL